MVDSVEIETFATNSVVAIVCIAMPWFCCQKCCCHDSHSVAIIPFATQCNSLPEIIYCHTMLFIAKNHILPHKVVHCHGSYCLLNDFIAIESHHQNFVAKQLDHNRIDCTHILISINHSLDRKTIEIVSKITTKSTEHSEFHKNLKLVEVQDFLTSI
jgi:hypothetical protein